MKAGMGRVTEEETDRKSWRCCVKKSRCPTPTLLLFLGECDKASKRRQTLFLPGLPPKAHNNRRSNKRSPHQVRKVGRMHGKARPRVAPCVCF
jgi:hypothetical protein